MNNSTCRWDESVWRIQQVKNSFVSLFLISTLCLVGCIGELGQGGAGGGSIGGGGGGSIDPNRGDNVAAFGRSVHNLTVRYCADCHNEDPTTIDASPKHAHTDPSVALSQSINEGMINTNKPEQSRLYQKLLSQHNCWTACADSANQMLAEINRFIGSASVDSNNTLLKLSSSPVVLIQSDDSINNVLNEAIVLYRFEEGSGAKTRDTSGIEPPLDLTLRKGASWAPGGGLRFSGAPDELAISSIVPTSEKLFEKIAGSNGSQEYTVETWILPETQVADPAAAGFIVSGNAGIPNIWGYGEYHDKVNASVAIENDIITPKHSGSSVSGGEPLSSNISLTPGQAMHIVVTYDAGGRRVFVNGVQAASGPPIGFQNWRSFGRLTVGNLPGGQNTFKGDVKYLAIYDQVIPVSQIQANYQEGASAFVTSVEIGPVRFDVSQLVDIPNSYIEMQVGEYDKASYFFSSPTLHLGSTGNFRVKGMRIAINGDIQTSAQAFAKVDIQVSGTEQSLSSIGTIMRKQDGPSKDQIALVFEEIAGKQNVTADPEIKSTISPKSAPSHGVGIPMLHEYYMDLATSTGIDPNNATVSSLYAELKTQLPTTFDAMSLNSGVQTAMTRLSSEFCSVLVGNRNLNSAFFGGNNASLNNRAQLYGALYNNFLQGGSRQVTLQQLSSELDTLISQLQGINLNDNAIIINTCTAVAASAATYLRD